MPSIYSFCTHTLNCVCVCVFSLSHLITHTWLRLPLTKLSLPADSFSAFKKTSSGLICCAAHSYTLPLLQIYITYIYIYLNPSLGFSFFSQLGWWSWDSPAETRLHESTFWSLFSTVSLILLLFLVILLFFCTICFSYFFSSSFSSSLLCIFLSICLPSFTFLSLFVLHFLFLALSGSSSFPFFDSSSSVFTSSPLSMLYYQVGLEMVSAWWDTSRGAYMGAHAFNENNRCWFSDCLFVSAIAVHSLTNDGHMDVVTPPPPPPHECKVLINRCLFEEVTNKEGEQRPILSVSLLPVVSRSRGVGGGGVLPRYWSDWLMSGDVADWTGSWGPGPWPAIECPPRRAPTPLPSSLWEPPWKKRERGELVRVFNSYLLFKQALILTLEVIRTP